MPDHLVFLQMSNLGKCGYFKQIHWQTVFDSLVSYTLKGCIPASFQNNGIIKNQKVGKSTKIGRTLWQQLVDR